MSCFLSAEAAEGPQLRPIVFLCEGCGWQVHTFTRVTVPKDGFCHECRWLEGIFRRHGVEVHTAVAMQLANTQTGIKIGHGERVRPVRGRWVE